MEKWNSTTETTFELNKKSNLVLKNTIHIGEGCKIKINENASLFFGGKSKAHTSGITCNTIILCSKSISIGSGTIISWNCYLSDSSQHEINGQIKIIPLFIGNHVWISEGVTCGPGCVIANNSIVGCKSYINRSFPSSVFIAGIPAKIIKDNINLHQ